MYPKKGAAKDVTKPVCGGAPALMDAGVPIKTPVAGIAMGLSEEGGRVAVLSDILSHEDHPGDMDFKVCGSRNGVTAVQMRSWSRLCSKRRRGRMFIQGRMAEALQAPREELNKYAPRIFTLKVKPDKIRDIIGPGGKTVHLADRCGHRRGRRRHGPHRLPRRLDGPEGHRHHQGADRRARGGRVLPGRGQTLADFGAFVEILPGTDGLVYISELDEKRVRVVEGICKEGDEMLVKVIGVDRASGKVRLSRREALGRTPKEVHNLRAGFST